jgi:hypothetical protein
VGGVHQVAVSLTHEQALVDYDPARIRPEQIASTLRDIGYDLYDPRKLRPFVEEEAQLVGEGVRLLAAATASLAAIGLIAAITGIWSVLVPASVVVVMVPIAYTILRPAGSAKAALGAAGIVAPGVAALVARGTGVLQKGPLIGWPAGALAVAVVLSYVSTDGVAADRTRGSRLHASWPCHPHPVIARRVRPQHRHGDAVPPVGEGFARAEGGVGQFGVDVGAQGAAAAARCAVGHGDRAAAAVDTGVDP